MLKPFLVSLEFLLFELFFHDLSTWSFPSLSFWIFFFLLWKNFKLRKVTIGQGIPIYLLLTCQYFATFALSFLVCVYVCPCAYLSELSRNRCTYHVPSPHNIEACYKKSKYVLLYNLSTMTRFRSFNVSITLPTIYFQISSIAQLWPIKQYFSEQPPTEE